MLVIDGNKVGKVVIDGSIVSKIVTDGIVVYTKDPGSGSFDFIINNNIAVMFTESDTSKIDLWDGKYLKTTYEVD